MRYLHAAIAIMVSSSAIFAGCSSSDEINDVTANPTVSMLDLCDSASFNAGLGAGTCVRAGGVTLTQFNNELAANHSVAAWRFSPAALTIRVGQSIQAMNLGGEGHSFTEVAQFGGGRVPALNAASGNTVEAPECAQLPSSAIVPPGGTFTTDAATETGVEHYQCCIHPWMRATVTVVQR